MDLIRSSYIGKMRLGEGRPVVSIRWFRAPRPFRVFKGQHAFCSGDWDDQKDATFLIGEQRPPRGSWWNSQAPAGFNSQSPRVGNDDDFRNGQTADQKVADASHGPEPLPCLYGAGLNAYILDTDARFRQGASQEGAVRFGNSPRAICTNFAKRLYAHWPAPQGCPVLDDLVVQLDFNEDTRTWTGSTIVESPHSLFIEFEAPGHDNNPASINLHWDTHGDISPTVDIPALLCTFPYTWSSWSWPIGGGACGGPCSVTVVDFP